MMQNKKESTRNKVPSVWRRISASLIDYLVILVWMAIVGFVGFALFLLMGGYPDYLGIFGPVGAQIIFFFVLTLPVGIYLFVTESDSYHASFGKRKVRIRVAQADDEALTKNNILVRTIVKLIPWEIAHTFVWQMQYVFYQNGYDADVPLWVFVGLNVSMILVIIYVAMIALRRDGRAPHDLVAGTRIIFAR